MKNTEQLLCSEIPENSLEFQFLVPGSRRLISAGNLETLLISTSSAKFYHVRRSSECHPTNWLYKIEV
jgi:hypothetical protein